MYIRQEILLSFEEIEKFSPPTKLELILSQIDLSEIMFKLQSQDVRTGPRGYCKRAMLYAVIARIVEKIPAIKALCDRLRDDARFRYNCGFDPYQPPPSQATFTRFMKQLEEAGIAELLFQQQRDRAMALGLIQKENVSIDATHVEAYERAVPWSKCKKEDNSPSWSVKVNTEGNKFYWYGWKVHVACDTFSGLPVAIMEAPAHTHDSQMAIHLISQIPYDPKAYIMDMGYDDTDIYEHIIRDKEALAIIPINERNSYAPPIGMTGKYQPMCSGGFPLTFWGRDGDKLKFRCPHVMGKVNCPHGSAWCSNSNYGYTLKVDVKENPRLYPGLPRDSKRFKELFNLRSSVERCNHRLKNHVMLESLRSSGRKAAGVHFRLCAVVLLAGTIAVNQVSVVNKAA
ncbi:MAG: transposase [Bacillota bacterium]|nr:transposase [Bacillota bacterium]